MAALVLVLGTPVVPAGMAAGQPPPAKTHPADKGESDRAVKTAANAEAALAKVLREWEKATPAASEFRSAFTWTCRREPIFPEDPAEETYRGEVFVSWPDRLRVEARDAAGKLCLVAVCRAGRATLYLYGSKQAFTFPFDLPARKPDVQGSLNSLFNSCLEEMAWIILGFPVQDLKGRFDVRIEKEDAQGTHVRLRANKRWGWLPDADWQVVLAKEGRWVRRVSRSYGDSELVVDFKEPEKRPNPPGTWEPPFKELPTGWITVDMEAPGLR